MYSPDSILLHATLFMGVRLIIAPHLRRYVAKHLTNCGFKTGKVACYPTEDSNDLTFVFEPGKQAKVLARVIMGIFRLTCSPLINTRRC